MSKRETLDMKLPTVGGLFTTQEMRDDEKRVKVIDVPLDELHDFNNHPFQVIQDEAMEELAQSIIDHGVVTPGLARPHPDGGYQLISGHRRKFASALAGNKTMPLIVKDLTEDEAVLFMVDSNLQRESILPSEKAFAYKMKLEAMNRQGKRTDLTSDPLGPKLIETRSNVELSDKTGDSTSQIKRYIRLTELLPEILKMVDEKKIAFRPAVEISYLLQNEQKMLLVSMEENLCTPSLAQAIKMKKMSQAKRLNEDVIFSIMEEEKPNQREKLTLSENKIGKFFPPEYSLEDREKVIVDLLNKWDRQRKARANAMER